MFDKGVKYFMSHHDSQLKVDQVKIEYLFTYIGAELFLKSHFYVVMIYTFSNQLIIEKSVFKLRQITYIVKIFVPN